MNIKKLQELLPQITEIKVLSRTAEINGSICHVMGIVRYEHSLRLLALQYDEDFAMRLEEAEIEKLNGLSEKVMTNREQMRGDREIDFVNIFQTVCNIKIGEVQFDVSGMESMRCDLQNWEIAVMFTEFLRRGWNPIGINYQNIENLILTSTEISGEYDSIPDLEENNALQLQTRLEHSRHLVEQPITLIVDEKYQDKLWFKEKGTEEKHWLMINRIYLVDMWKEVMDNFDDPRFKEQLTKEELEKAKADFVSHFSTICPEGMCFPAIEYECEEGITLQFYSKEWLDAEPVVNGSSSMGFISKPDKNKGVLGLELKMALIQEPVPKDTQSIEAELFWYNKLEKHEDVII